MMYTASQVLTELSGRIISTLNMDQSHNTAVIYENVFICSRVISTTKVMYYDYQVFMYF